MRVRATIQRAMPGRFDSLFDNPNLLARPDWADPAVPMLALGKRFSVAFLIGQDLSQPDSGVRNRPNTRRVPKLLSGYGLRAGGAIGPRKRRFRQ